jgi:hypothetical protein
MKTKPNLPNLPLVDIPTFGFMQDYNRKFKAYDVTVTKGEVKTQPIGGDGLDAEGIYPVPRVVKETKDTFTVKYAGVGMGDGPWERVFYRTADAARRGALKWLNGAAELTEEQKTVIDRDKKMKIRNELKEWIAHQKKLIVKKEAEVARLTKELGA